jgi:hypothetical protein
MGGQWAGLGFVEGIHQFIETRGIGKAIALADGVAQHVAEFEFVFGGDGWGLRARIAELGELAPFAKIQEMAPDFMAGWRGIVGLAIARVERFEMRGIGEIVGGSINLLIDFDEGFAFHRSARLDAGKEAQRSLGIFDMSRGARAIGGAIEEEEDVTEGIFDGGAVAARNWTGRGDERQAELGAALVEIADVVDEVVNCLGGKIGITVEDKFGVFIGELEIREAGILLEQLHSQDIAIILHRAFQLRDAEENAIDPSQHRCLEVSSYAGSAAARSLWSSRCSFSVG